MSKPEAENKPFYGLSFLFSSHQWLCYFLGRQGFVKSRHPDGVSVEACSVLRYDDEVSGFSLFDGTEGLLAAELAFGFLHDGQLYTTDRILIDYSFSFLLIRYLVVVR